MARARGFCSLLNVPVGERVRRGRKSYPSAAAEHELCSSPRRWPLCLWLEERRMATSASPATAVLLTVLLISSFSATLASQPVRGETFLLLRKGLWSALTPLSCAAECLLGIFALTVLKLSSLGAASSSVRHYRVIQRIHAAPCKLYIDPGLCCFPSFPCHPKPKSCPSWGPGAGKERASAQRALWAGSCLPPGMLRASYLYAGQVAARGVKHKDVSDKAEIIRKSKQSHAANVACPRFSETKPCLWCGSLPGAFRRVSDIRCSVCCPVWSLMPPGPTSFMAMYPPAASFELSPRAGRVQPTRPSCSCSAESQRFGLRAGAMSRQSITLCSPVS